MRVLMTGMSARSVGSQKIRYDYVSFSDLMRRTLEDLGHEVDMRVVPTGDWDLSMYDRALVHVGWASSLSSMHVHEAALALSRLGEKAVLYYDDWRHSPFDDIWAHVKDEKGWTRHTTKFRPEEYGRMSDEEKAAARDALCAIIDPAGCPWTVVVPMHGAWANVERFKEDGRKAQLNALVVPIDPTPMVRLPAGVVAPARWSDKERRWVFATLREHEKFVQSIRARATWPVEVMGAVKKGPGGTRPGAFGKMDGVRPEGEVVQRYADSTGMLVAPYTEFLDGSGWWRPRYTFAAEVGTIALVTGPRDIEFLDGPYSNVLEDIEAADDDQLEDLAVRQRARLEEISWTEQQWRDALDRIVRTGR